MSATAHRPIESYVARDGRRYRIDDLRTAFDAVCDPDDWKGPIAAWVPGEAVLTVCEAIRFFTATEPKVALDVETMRYLITSEGYRAGPAGP